MGYRQPFSFQYFYRIKLTTFDHLLSLRPCLKF